MRRNSFVLICVRGAPRTEDTGRLQDATNARGFRPVSPFDRVALGSTEGSTKIRAEFPDAERQRGRPESLRTSRPYTFKFGRVARAPKNTTEGASDFRWLSRNVSRSENLSTSSLRWLQRLMKFIVDFFTLESPSTAEVVEVMALVRQRRLRSRFL